ncbi:unnamed protein product [Peniophora sp. CBMAI 1063]|nr:unnamed protein product [Peniophora sp. CBMAI 1063]
MTSTASDASAGVDVDVDREDIETKPVLKAKGKGKRGGKKKKAGNDEIVDGRGRPRLVPDRQLADIRTFAARYIDRRDAKDSEGVKAVFRDAVGKIMGKYDWEDPLRELGPDEEVDSDAEGEEITEARVKAAMSKKNPEADDAVLATVYKRVKSVMFQEYTKAKSTKPTPPLDAKKWLMKMFEHPKRQPEYLFFYSRLTDEMKEEIESLKSAAAAEAEQADGSPKPGAPYTNIVAAKYLKLASDEVKAEVAKEREDHYETEVAQWKRLVELKPASRAEARTFLELINGQLVPIAQSVAELVSGMCVWITAAPGMVLCAEGTLDVPNRVTKSFSQIENDLVKGFGTHVMNQSNLLNDLKWPVDMEEAMASGALETLDEYDSDDRWPVQVDKVAVPPSEARELARRDRSPPDAGGSQKRTDATVIPEATMMERQHEARLLKPMSVVVEYDAPRPRARVGDRGAHTPQSSAAGLRHAPSAEDVEMTGFNALPPLEPEPNAVEKRVPDSSPEDITQSISDLPPTQDAKRKRVKKRVPESSTADLVQSSSDQAPAQDPKPKPRPRPKPKPTAKTNAERVLPPRQRSTSQQIDGGGDRNRNDESDGGLEPMNDGHNASKVHDAGASAENDLALSTAKDDGTASADKDLALSTAKDAGSASADKDLAPSTAKDAGSASAVKDASSARNSEDVGASRDKDAVAPALLDAQAETEGVQGGVPDVEVERSSDVVNARILGMTATLAFESERMIPAGVDTKKYLAESRAATQVLEARAKKKWFVAIRMGAFLTGVATKLPVNVKALGCKVAQSYWEFESSNVVEGRLRLESLADGEVRPKFAPDLLRKLAGGALTRISWPSRATKDKARTGAQLDEDVGVLLAEQWALQQPAARRDGEGRIVVAASKDMDWGDRLCGGLSGVRVLVVTLLGWGANLTSIAESREWKRLAVDFVDVLDILRDKAGPFVEEDGDEEKTGEKAGGNKRERKPSARVLEGSA